MTTSPQVAIHHLTKYIYDRPVAHTPHVIRLRPAPHNRTPILSYSQTIVPKKHFINWQQDTWSNWLAKVVMPERTDLLVVQIDMVARLDAINPFDFYIDEHASQADNVYLDDQRIELKPFLVVEDPSARLQQFIDGAPPIQGGTIDFVVQLNQYVANAVGYIVRMEPGVFSPDECLKQGKGSCRDSAWLLINVLRHLGFASRFVSGYLVQLVPDEDSLDGGTGPTEDFVDLHAWAEVYLPGAGWVGLDATSGLLAGEGHIPLACAPMPTSAAPIEGATEKCEASFEHKMTVTRLNNPARSTAPMSDESYSRLKAAGRAADLILAQKDVRLTMGGEPTFVCATDRDAPEWTTSAVGPTKRGYADKLLRRMYDRFAKGGAIHHGQGKWYPGEQLPRWSFEVHWRKDGVPIWKRPDLIAAEDSGDLKAPAKAGHQAKAFVDALSQNLGLSRSTAKPAFEDPVEYIWREQNLPLNRTSKNNQVNDPLARRRIAKVFDQDLGAQVAQVLPLSVKDRAYAKGQVTWQSEVWETKREELFLIPGDSPAGLRLPMESLLWLAKDHVPTVEPVDPGTQPRRMPDQPLTAAAAQKVLGQLPQDLRQQQSGSTKFVRSEAKNAGPVGQSGENHIDDHEPATWLSGIKAFLSRSNLVPPWGRKWFEPHGPTQVDTATGDNDVLDPRHLIPANARALNDGSLFDQERYQKSNNFVRTALVVEPREGILHVFLPPVSTLEDYVALVTAVEATANQLEQPVRLEGYTPPKDSRLQVFKITPDPGVIEVNIHPVNSFDEQEEVLSALYQDAREIGLDASSYKLDGRPAGSGGGNHIVMGGAHPSDSPFLRRPDLLGSVLRFWNNHPSLSYMFSGQFVGPTSQAPRMDEARLDSLYELELALNQLATAQNMPAWTVDRLFRDLLTDVAGNAHRTEICIDKLYSPDGVAGRLGLVEFRAFEMPPNPKMAMAQNLLLRALIAGFWQTPYSGPLQHWGTQLHDKFMLPHYLQQDLEAVLAQAEEMSNVKMELDWFTAQQAFRFPIAGQATFGKVQLRLTSALEPWPVLGEEGVASGTTRFVDNSMDRLQIDVLGPLGDKVVAVNGVVIPLTQVADEHFVHGIKFRAWNPTRSLHPTLGVDAPLRFDLVDADTTRSLGGFTYHAEHPGGRNLDERPVNALEAEGRTLARFEASYTGREVPLKKPRTHELFAHTLDLRWN